MHKGKLALLATGVFVLGLIGGGVTAYIVDAQGTRDGAEQSQEKAVESDTAAPPPTTKTETVKDEDGNETTIVRPI